MFGKTQTRRTRACRSVPTIPTEDYPARPCTACRAAPTLALPRSSSQHLTTQFLAKPARPNLTQPYLVTPRDALPCLLASLNFLPNLRYRATQCCTARYQADPCPACRTGVGHTELRHDEPNLPHRSQRGGTGTHMDVRCQTCRTEHYPEGPCQTDVAVPCLPRQRYPTTPGGPQHTQPCQTCRTQPYREIPHPTQPRRT